MRRTELDLCRITGCLMVLIIHAGAEIYHNVPLESLEFALLNLISTSVRGGVPIFFMLTGALMLSRESLDIKKLLKNHVLFLVEIFLLWSLIYTLIRSALAGDFGTVYDFVYSVISGHYHMWFIPTMVLCYFFIPPAHAAIHGYRLDVKYLLLMVFLLVLLPANMNLTPDTAPILFKITQHFDFFYLPYMAYVIWGWWLSTRQMPRCTLWLAPLVFLLTCLVTSAGNHWYSMYKETADGWLFSYFSLPNFIEASAVFCFFLALKDRQFKHAGIITKLADCTLGVYLIHPMMINLLEKLGLEISPAAPVSGLFVMFAALAISCFALVYPVKHVLKMKNLM